jgi:AbiU2
MSEESWQFCVVGYDANDGPSYLGFTNTLDGAEKLRANAKTIGWRKVAVLDAAQQEIAPLSQVFSAIEQQIRNAKTYFAVSQSFRKLLETDLGIFSEAPTFFGMTVEGNIELAEMTVARLYDRSDNTVTIWSMLAQAKRESGSFTSGNEKEVCEAIEQAEAIVAELQPILAAIKHRRNKWFAHLDVRTVTDPQELNARANLQIPELEQVLRETEKIFENLERLYSGIIGPITYLGGEDYKRVIKRIREAQAAEGKARASWAEKHHPQDGGGPES